MGGRNSSEVDVLKMRAGLANLLPLYTIMSAFWCILATIPQFELLGRFLIFTEVARSFPWALLLNIWILLLLTIIHRGSVGQIYVVTNGTVSFVTSAVFLLRLYPFYIVPLGTNAPSPRSHAFSVVVANAEFGWHSAAQLMQACPTPPDILVVSEATFSWGNDPALEQYPYKFEMLGKGAEGTAIYSMRPIKSSAPINVRGMFNTLTADIDFGDETLTVLALHAPPPQWDLTQRYRRMYLTAVGDYLRSRPNAKILIAGDLNTTPFSTTYNHFVEMNGLKNAASGFGLVNTWHVRDLGLLGAAIDHVFYRNLSGISSVKTLPSFGSDHLPLLVEGVI